MNSRERELLVKQEGDPNYKKLPSSARSSHKNPRIVRVSGSFGGKDRHSKVCTVRGLRDRRIRLSVPTAIQLYDLQDKLGLSMPSKVVDWLLDASKNDIDNLPPLPIIPGAFRTHFQESPNPQTIQSKPNFGMMKQGEEGPLGNASQSSHSTMPYNPYFQWDIRHPNLSLSHLGGAYTLPNQEDDQSSFHLYFPYYITPSMENLQQNPLSSTLLNPSSPMKLRESGVI